MKRVLFLIVFATSIHIYAQTPTDSSRLTPEKNELKYNLNASGTHYFKVTFLNQVWLRYTESNPGTTVNGALAAQTFDIGLRRTRIQLFGQLTDRTFLYFQFGQNNFNFLSGYPSGNRKLSAFFHDALGEYHVFKGKDYLKLGGGLTIVNGLSRFSQPSVSSILTMDVPVFAQATVDQTDEFSRKLSIYARGQVGKLDYRFVLSDPFPIQSNGTTPPALSSNATFAQQGHHKQYQGLLMYQFFDKESQITPGYITGTYLGQKKIFNLEAGLITQKRATWSLTDADTLYHNMVLWSAAAFLDIPLNKAKRTALSAYVGYFDYNFGPGYLRYNGIMNPASGTNSPITGVSGTQGNAFPMFGTGHIVYSQVGYLFRNDLLGTQGALQPYASLLYADYNRLGSPMGVWNVGINWLLKGHNSKFSLDYQNRPVYRTGTDFQLQQTGHRSSVVLQYQLFM